MLDQIVLQVLVMKCRHGKFQAFKLLLILPCYPSLKVVNLYNSSNKESFHLNTKSRFPTWQLYFIPARDQKCFARISFSSLPVLATLRNTGCLIYPYGSFTIGMGSQKICITSQIPAYQGLIVKVRLGLSFLV